MHEELVAEMENDPVHLVHNPEWQEGMGSSIRAGVIALQQTDVSKFPDSVLILLCDQPLITAAHLNLLITQFYLHKNSIVVATSYAAIQGVPAIFDKSLFITLAKLPGNRGAQWLFKQYENQLTVVPFEGAAIDVDTEEDYLRLLDISNN